MEIPSDDRDPAVLDKGFPPLHRLPTTARQFGGPPRRQGELDAKTTRGPRDGSRRSGALMTDRDATIDWAGAGAESDSSESRIAMMAKKLRCINKSPGASKSRAVARRRRRF